VGTIRSGHESGEEGFLVFDNGTMLEYPRYSKASNGFVRGPKGEKVGRGSDAEIRAEEMCRDAINRWIEQFQKFGYKFVGTTVPMRLKTRYSSYMQRERTDWVKGTSPSDLKVLVKAYWQDAPDTWDLIEINLSISRYRGGSTLTTYRIASVYRPTNADPAGPHRDAEGLITTYLDNTAALSERLFHTQGNPRDVIIAFSDQLEAIENLVKTNYAKADWSHDLTNLRETISDFLDAKAVIAKLVPVLEQAAELYGKLGEFVTMERRHDTNGDEYPVLRIEGSEHTLIISPTEMQPICHYERDEVRLNNLKKQRLEAELLELHNEFGDVRNTD
jgi:hypothetical protein